MKKIITSIIIFIIMIISIYIPVNAEDGTNNNALIFKSSISAKDREVRVKIISGQTISEDKLIGFQAKLIYDNAILKYNSIEVADKYKTIWNASYGDTGTVLIEPLKTTKITENDEIASIIFKIQDGIDTLDTNIELKEIELTADETQIIKREDNVSTTLNVKLTKSEETTPDVTNPDTTKDEGTKENDPEPNVTPDEQKKDEPKKEETKDNSNKDDSAKTQRESDKTISSNKLPKTGAFKIATIILLVGVFAVVCLLRYKSIQIK